MSMPDRAREQEEFEQALLASAKDDEMRPGRKAALAASLGVGGGALVAAGTAKAAAAGVAASKAKAAVTLALVKWLAAAAVGGVVVVGVTTSVRHARDIEERERQANDRAPAAVPLPPTRQAPATPTATPTPTATATATTTSAAASPLPTAEPTAAAKAPAAPQSPRAATTAPTVATNPASVSTGTRAAVLADEQRTIEDARAALARGDVAQARRALDAHDRAFPDGAFAEEAQLLRIDALARSGERARARREARAFLTRAPQSPYATRLRELADAPDDP